MSKISEELDEVRNRLTQLTELKESPGWQTYLEDLKEQGRLAREQIVKPPKDVSNDERVYAAGLLRGLELVESRLGLLIEGLQSELDLLKHVESQDDDRDTSDAPALADTLYFGHAYKHGPNSGSGTDAGDSPDRVPEV